MFETTAHQLIQFIQSSPTAFHAVNSITEILKENGFKALSEADAWNVVPGGKYYVTRNGSSVIAFKAGERLNNYSFMMSASHSDSPTFKIKENAEISVRGHYTTLNTEGYGGMLCATWFDRPLSIAGRVIVRTESGTETRLLAFDRDLTMIPSLAIHMDRTVNDGHAYNRQVDMLPVLGEGDLGKNALNTLIAEELHVNRDDIIGSDLYLYNRTPASVWGVNREYISCPQLDDLQCAYASLQGFLMGSHPDTVSVYACFDNEEVGSGTKQGAASTFLSDTLQRLNRALGKNEEDYARAVANGFMISCDNAHAVHPNFPEKTDSGNCAYMNEGLVVKSHAGQKYTSDAVSIALLKTLCAKVEVPLQFFANRSDMQGGSTLGNIAMSHVSLNAVDVGLPQLAMHSCYETAGIKDTEYLIRTCKALYCSCFRQNGEGTYTIR